jgi:hypothetical protein
MIYEQRYVMFCRTFSPNSFTFSLSVVMRACWDGRTIQAQSNQICTLKQRLAGYRLQLDHAQARITHLTDQLACAFRDDANINPIRTLRDCVLSDIFQNRDRPPTARRYAPDTLHWAWRVFKRSSAAWKLVHDVLPLPGERALQHRFAKTGTVISEALIDIKQNEQGARHSVR